MPRVSKLVAKNFLRIAEAELVLGDFTMLWGVNEAGKSSLVKALDHALTGGVPRDANVGDLIRQGAKRMEVEVTVANRSIIRTRKADKGEVWLDGEPMTKSAGVEGHIAQLLGVPARAVIAGLRSGAILEMKGADLQQLLSGLTGTDLTATSIRFALGDDVVAAAERVGLTLPTSLAQFASTTKAAEDERRAGKRLAEERDLDIQKLVSPEAGAVNAAAGLTLEAARKAANEARKAHDAAAAAQATSAGATEERRRTLEERRAQLAAVPEKASKTFEIRQAEKQLADGEADLKAAAVELATLERSVPGLKQRAEGDTTVAAGAESIAARLADAEADLKTAQRTVDLAAAEEARARTQATKAAAAGGHCPTCSSVITSELIAKLKADGETASTATARERKLLEYAQQLAVRLRAESASFEAAKARHAAAAELALVEIKIGNARRGHGAAEKRAAEVRERLVLLRTLEEQFGAWQRAQADLQAVDKQLAALAAPPPSVDLSELAAKMARAELLQAAVVYLGERDRLRKLRDAALQSVEDADAVAQACGPKGVRPQLVAKAIGPFVAAANEALAELATECRVDVDVDGELGFVVHTGSAVVPPSLLSDGARTRLLFALQFAVVRLSGAPLVALDRIELLDQAGRTALKRMAVASGVQVLMLSCADAPAAVPEGVAGYVVEAGRVRRVPTATPVAA